jgi:hypothetical protein
LFVLFVLAIGPLFLLNTYYNLRALFPQFTMYPALNWRMLLIILLSFPLHELGHISACHRYRVPVGSIGAGFYMLFPVMYVDLSAIWILPRSQRTVVNLGGVYFDFIGACIFSAVAAVTKNCEYGLISLAYLASCVINLNPFAKFDGYWCVSDILGVPWLYQRALSSWRGWLMGKPSLLLKSWQRISLMIFSAMCVLVWTVSGWAVFRLVAAAYRSLWLLTVIGFCPRRVWWQLSPADAQAMLLIGCVTLFLLSFCLNFIGVLVKHRQARRAPPDPAVSSGSIRLKI